MVTLWSLSVVAMGAAQNILTALAALAKRPVKTLMAAIGSR